MAHHYSLEDNIFGYLIRSGFHHYDAVFRAGDNKIEFAFFKLPAKAAGCLIRTTTSISNLLDSHSAEKTAMGSLKKGRFLKSRQAEQRVKSLAMPRMFRGFRTARRPALTLYLKRRQFSMSLTYNCSFSSQTYVNQ